MRYSVEMDGKSDSQSRLTVQTASDLRSGNLVEITLTGQTLEVRYLSERSHLQKLHRRELQTGIKKYIIDAESPYIVRSGEALAYIIQYHGETRAGDSRGQLLTEPIKTIDTSNRYGLVTAFITKYYKTGIGQGCDEPLHTITTSPGHFGLVSAFLIKYYGGGCGQTLDRPLDTITTKDRFGLVNVILDIEGEKYIISDIFLRMMKPEELKLMQGSQRITLSTGITTGRNIRLQSKLQELGTVLCRSWQKSL